MRILVSAFSFSPYRGSECAVGWNIANELAKLHDVTVICGDVSGNLITKRELESFFGKHVEDSCSFCQFSNRPSLVIEYVPPSKLIVIIERLHKIPGLWALYYLAYNLWQRKAYQFARKLHQVKPFDAVHQLTMIGYREPGYMWKLGIPYFWGPVGGNADEPLEYSGIYSMSGKIKAYLRHAINAIQKRVLLRPRIAAQSAKKIWAVTVDDVKTITQLWGADCEQMTETAAARVQNVKKRVWNGMAPLRIVWSGTHTYGKAMPILIHAVASLGDVVLRERRLVVDVLGKGDETEKWKRLAGKLHVGTFFNWFGYLPRREALELMDKAHLLIFTSVKEGTPHVVLEALALGLPVVCHDACGMGAVVTDRCGFKVPLERPETSIVGIANAIKTIFDNPGIIAEKSVAALQRALELTWEEKAHRISDAYNEVCK